MAMLTSDVRFEWDTTHSPSLAQVRADAAATFYRGALAHSHLGKATITPLLNERFIGPVWQRATVAAGDLVTIAVTGRFHLWSPGFVDAEYGELFAVSDALSDDPADLAVIDYGFAGPAGTLDQVVEDGVSGWLNIDRRG